MNFLERYVEYCTEITDAPVDFHTFMGVATVACVLQNNVYLPYAGGRLFPNLWLILLAPSSKFRKTTALNIPKRLISRINPALIYPNEFSREGILKSVSKNSSGVFFFSEFSSLMGLLNRDYMGGAKGMLADWYDSPDIYQKDLTKESFTIEYPAINIFSATSTAWFLDNLKETDIQGGFLPRFIIIPAATKTLDYSLPPMGDEEKRVALLDDLRTFSQISGVAYLREDALKIQRQWYSAFTGRMDGGRFDVFINRLQTSVLKFAMILQVIYKQNLKIEKEAMEEATHLVNWLAKKMLVVEQTEMTFTQSQKNIKRALIVIKNKKEITRSDLLRFSNLSVRELDPTIQTLIERESVGVRRERIGTHKKAATIYSYLDGDD